MKFFRNDLQLRFWDDEVLLDIHGVLTKLLLEVTPPNLPFAKGEG